MYHTLNFHHTPIPHLKPKQQLCKPRPKIDLETLELVKDENQLFDGSYFQYDDPTKRQYPSYTLGYRRPIVERGKRVVAAVRLNLHMLVMMYVLCCRVRACGPRRLQRSHRDGRAVRVVHLGDIEAQAWSQCLQYAFRPVVTWVWSQNAAEVMFRCRCRRHEEARPPPHCTYIATAWATAAPPLAAAVELDDTSHCNEMI